MKKKENIGFRVTVEHLMEKNLNLNHGQKNWCEHGQKITLYYVPMTVDNRVQYSKYYIVSRHVFIEYKTCKTLLDFDASAK